MYATIDSVKIICQASSMFGNHEKWLIIYRVDTHMTQARLWTFNGEGTLVAYARERIARCLSPFSDSINFVARSAICCIEAPMEQLVCPNALWMLLPVFTTFLSSDAIQPRLIRGDADVNAIALRGRESRSTTDMVYQGIADLLTDDIQMLVLLVDLLARRPRQCIQSSCNSAQCIEIAVNLILHLFVI